jgi:hypothetical protein
MKTKIYRNIILSVFCIDVKRGLSHKGRTNGEIFEKRDLCTIFGPKSGIGAEGYRIMISFMACLPHKTFG